MPDDETTTQPVCPAHGNFGGPHCPARMGDGSWCGHPGTPQDGDAFYADEAADYNRESRDDWL